MQVNEKTAEGLVRAYEITVPASDIDAKVTEKLEAHRKDFSMKGFRKGKAPISLMRKMFGQSVMGETIQEMVDGSVRDLIAEKDHRPAMNPDIKMVNEDFKEGDDLEVAVNYELLPDVPEVDFSSIKLEKLVVEVGDDAVSESLDRLAQDAVDYGTKDGAAEDKDQIIIDFTGRIDGEAFEGGAAEDFPLVLGSGQFIPGFEEQLIGAKAGDEKDVEVSFPDDYGNEQLKGQAAVFETKIKEVKAPKAAEINDDLAKRFGSDDLDALKATIRERVAAEYNQASRAHLKRKLLDALDTKVDFELPPTMLDIEAKQVAHQLWHEENPEVEGHDHPEIEPTEEHTRIAKRRVMLGLLLADLGSKNNIQVQEEELRNAIMQQARQYPGQERQFFDFIRENQNAMNEIQAPLFEDKVIDHILEQAVLEEKSVTKEELESALEALETDAV
jgi:trigger factor